MKHKAALRIGLVLALLGGTIGLVIQLKDQHFAVLQTSGIIATKERNLMIAAILLMLIVVVPVFVLTIGIVYKYRVTNVTAKKASYAPYWDHNKYLEFFWWAVPFLIILTLAIITWNSSHSLDPYKPLNSSTKPITIQVIALQWKWLFIYPEQHIATVNYVQFPANMPVNFEITSDAPMNSFWIPELGGQIYAMTGMSTQLHLIADHEGIFGGRSANLSGSGFARMQFAARATSDSDFVSWINSVKSRGVTLDEATYDQLSKPSETIENMYYSDTQTDLYTNVIHKYMTEGPSLHDEEHDMSESMGSM